MNPYSVTVIKYVSLALFLIVVLVITPGCKALADNKDDTSKLYVTYLEEFDSYLKKNKKLWGFFELPKETGKAQPAVGRGEKSTAEPVAQFGEPQAVVLRLCQIHLLITSNMELLERAEDSKKDAIKKTLHEMLENGTKWLRLLSSTKPKKPEKDTGAGK